MLQLIRKEWSTTAWVHLVAIALGIGLTVVCLLEPENSSFMSAFTYLIYTHLVFTQCRFSAANRPDNLLLNSLPLSRGQVVAGKYLYVVSSTVLYAAYLGSLMAIIVAFGVAASSVSLKFWLLMVVVGIMYHMILLPLSYLDARYGVWGSMLVYVAILTLPHLLGQGNAGPAIAAFVLRLNDWTNHWIGLGLLLLAMMGVASLIVSRRLYKRTEF